MTSSPDLILRCFAVAQASSISKQIQSIIGLPLNRIIFQCEIGFWSYPKLLSLSHLVFISFPACSSQVRLADLYNISHPVSNAHQLSNPPLSSERPVGLTHPIGGGVFCFKRPEPKCQGFFRFINAPRPVIIGDRAPSGFVK